jgi:hypothetical protein
LANAKAIAAGTRVVSVSFTVFSAAHGRVAACQLVLELVPGTDPHASSHFKASRSLKTIQTLGHSRSGHSQ